MQNKTNPQVKLHVSPQEERNGSGRKRQRRGVTGETIGKNDKARSSMKTLPVGEGSIST